MAIKKVSSTLNSIEILTKIIEVILVMFMVIMTISMSLLVVTRYLFGTGITWTEELTRFSNVWLIFLGASVLAYSNSHINVTILDDILKGKAKKILLLTRDLIYIIYCALIINVGIKALEVVSSQTSPNMLIKMNYIYIAIPLGAALTIIYLVYNWTNINRKGKING